jgi:hypothetical protein
MTPNRRADIRDNMRAASAKYGSAMAEAIPPRSTSSNDIVRDSFRLDEQSAVGDRPGCIQAPAVVGADDRSLRRRRFPNGDCIGDLGRARTKTCYWRLAGFRGSVGQFNGAVSSAVCLQAIFEHPDGKALILILQNRHGRS